MSTPRAPLEKVTGLGDVFALELLKNALASIADEMAVTVARTARSFVIKEALDFSTALFNRQGELIAQGTCLPLHLGSMPVAIEAVMRAYPDGIFEGDIFALNDPYDGSTHLPDVVCVRPIFVAGQLAAFAATLAHQTDIGGRVPGGNASDSTEIYQEGLRIPPLKLYENDEPVEAIFRLIARNVRVPNTVLGDIRSQVSACYIGERELLKLIDKTGLTAFEATAQDLLDYAERFTRNEIAKLADGDYYFTDYLDGDGIVPGAIRFDVKVSVHGDSMTVDFTGTSKQVKGAINSVFAFTASATWASVRSILDQRIPNNAGYFRPIKVVAPLGTIVNPRPPAAVAARGLTGFRIADTVFGALAQIAPHLVPACGSSSPDAGVSVGGYYADGTPFVFLEFLVGSWGGGPNTDGMDACTGMIINYSNTPAELLETEQPLRVEAYGYVADSGGAGQFRGGLALQRHLRFLADDTTVQVRSDRRDKPPYGLHGGQAGASSGVSIVCATGALQDQPAKFLATVNSGDLLKVRLAGGGGYGCASRRDAGAVLADVLDGKLTLEHARREYGVVILGQPLHIDADATQTARAAMLKC
jgi:N-methylhydantoinase B